MRATLVPLKGKYYETQIQTDNFIISLSGGYGRASDREIINCGYTLKEYTENKVNPESEFGETVREIVNDPGGHYEKQDVYEAALRIVGALNA